MSPVGTALRRTGAASTGPPTFTNTIAAYWASDPLWSNPGDGNAVATWRDYSGQGCDATAAGSVQPVYRATSSLNSQPVVEFDNTDDYMTATIPSTSATNPHTMIQIFRSGAAWTSALRFIGGVSDSTSFNKYEQVAQSFANVRAYDTTGYFDHGGTGANNTNYVWRMKWDTSTNSAWSINNSTTTNSTLRARSGLALLWLGRSGFPIQTQLAYMAYIDGDATADANWSSFVSWVSTTYGLTIS